MTFKQFLLNDNVKLLKQIFEAQTNGAKNYIKILLNELNKNNKELYLLEKKSI